MQIMKIIEHKMTIDNNFADWVREEMHRETLNQERVLLLEGGSFPPTLPTFEEFPGESPFGHSDVDPRGGGSTNCTTLMTRVPPRIENTPVKKIPLTLN